MIALEFLQLFFKIVKFGDLTCFRKVCIKCKCKKLPCSPEQTDRGACDAAFPKYEIQCEQNSLT